MRNWFYLISFFVLGCSPALATQWAPREDLGIAAVDRATGEVLWEAWDIEELPPAILPAENTAAKELLSAREGSDNPDPGIPRFPLQLRPDRVVTYRYDSPASLMRLTLTHGTTEQPGAAIAEFAFPSQAALYAHGDGMLYVLTGGAVHALTARDQDGGKAWEPQWKRDLPESKLVAISNGVHSDRTTSETIARC